MKKIHHLFYRDNDFLGHFGKLVKHLHQHIFTGETLPTHNWQILFSLEPAHASL